MTKGVCLAFNYPPLIYTGEYVGEASVISEELLESPEPWERRVGLVKTKILWLKRFPCCSLSNKPKELKTNKTRKGSC